MPYDRQHELSEQYRRHLQSLGPERRVRNEHQERHENYVISHTDPGNQDYLIVKFDHERTYYVCYPARPEDYTDLILNYSGNVIEELRTRSLSITVLPDDLTVRGDLIVGVDVLALPDNLTVGNNMYIARNYNKVDFKNLNVTGSFVAECMANFDVTIATNERGFVRLHCGESEVCKC